MSANREMFKRARIQSGFTQEGLARIMGVTVGAVHGWENGSKIPGKPTQRELARVLDCEAIIDMFDTETAARKRNRTKMLQERSPNVA